MALALAWLCWLSLAQVACDSRPRATTGQPVAPRIVSLHDVSTEIVVGLGLEQKLVGLELLVDPLPALRAAVIGVPQVSSLESIVALRPTHVVGLKVTGNRDPELVRRLRELGVSVVLGDPTTLSKSVAFIQQLAETFQRSSEGRVLAGPLQAELNRKSPTNRPGLRVDHTGALSVQPAQGERWRPQVFVYDCCEPPFSAGGGGLLNELLQRAGGRNIFDDLKADWASVSWEEVVARQPELIVIHSYDYEGQKDVQSKLATLRKIPGLATVPTAVLPLGCSLGGLRSVEGLTRLRVALEKLQP